MSNINKAIISGNVGKDPEIREFEDGGKVASFSVATTQKGYTTRSGNEIQERTEWHNIRCSGGLAKLAEMAIVKGSKVVVEGEIRYRSYEDKDGVKRYITEIYADNIDVLSGSRKDVTDEEQPQYATAPEPYRRPSLAEQRKANEEAAKRGDDLPF